MDSSKPDPIDVIIDDLHLFHDENDPVELWWNEDDYCSGYVSAVEDNYVVLARLFQKAWLNGFLAARFTAIHEVLPVDDDDEEFLARAMDAQGVTLPPRLPVRAATLEELLSSVCEHFPMIIVESRNGTEETDVGGTILRIEGNTAWMRLLSRQGRWLEGEHELDLSLVTKVFFGSRYERVLEDIGAYLDGKETLR